MATQSIPAGFQPIPAGFEAVDEPRVPAGFQAVPEGFSAIEEAAPTADKLPRANKDGPPWLPHSAYKAFGELTRNATEGIAAGVRAALPFRDSRRGGNTPTPDAQPATPKALPSGRTVTPPGPAKPPVPPGLMTPEQQRAAEPILRSRTGQLYQTTPRGTFPVLDAPGTGVGNIAEGVAQIAEPGYKEKLQGGSKVITGLGQVAEPLAAAGVLTAPVGTAATLLGTMAVQSGTRKALRKVGVSPEVSDFTADVAALLAGAGGGAYLLRKAYRAAGSPEVKVGGKFPEPKPLTEMTDAELVAHANDVENTRPKNYEFQREEIAKEVLTRRAGRGMGPGEETAAPTPAEPPQGFEPVEEPPLPATIKKGQEFETGAGTFRVLNNASGQIIYQQTTPDGTKHKPSVLSEERFQELVKPTAQESEVAPVSPAPRPSAEPAPPGNDPQYQDAVQLVRGLGKASTSSLQRSLRMGYGRAAGILEQMERDGIVGPAGPSGAREILKLQPEQVPAVQPPAPAIVPPEPPATPTIQPAPVQVLTPEVEPQSNLPAVPEVNYRRITWRGGPGNYWVLPDSSDKQESGPYPSAEAAARALQDEQKGTKAGAVVDISPTREPPAIPEKEVVPENVPAETAGARKDAAADLEKQLGDIVPINRVPAGFEPVEEPPTPEEIGKKLVGGVRQQAMESAGKGVEQPQPPAELPEIPAKEPAKVLEFKKAEAPGNEKRVAEIDAKLARLQAQYEASMNEPQGFKPPAIGQDARASIARQMDKLDAERDKLTGRDRKAEEALRLEDGKKTAERLAEKYKDVLNPPSPEPSTPVEKPATPVGSAVVEEKPAPVTPEPVGAASKPKEDQPEPAKSKEPAKPEFVEKIKADNPDIQDGEYTINRWPGGQYQVTHWSRGLGSKFGSNFPTLEAARDIVKTWNENYVERAKVDEKIKMDRLSEQAQALRSENEKLKGKPAVRKPSHKEREIIEKRREFFTPGNVVTSYFGQDRILKYEEFPSGAFRVQAQAVDKEGNPLPGEKPRWHATPPDKNSRVISKAEPETATASESTVPQAGDRVQVGDLTGKVITPITISGKPGFRVRLSDGTPKDLLADRVAPIAKPEAAMASSAQLPSETRSEPSSEADATFREAYAKGIEEFSKEREKEYPSAELMANWNSLQNLNSSSEAMRGTVEINSLEGSRSKKTSKITLKSGIEGVGKKRHATRSYVVEVPDGRIYTYQWENPEHQDWAGARALARARGLNGRDSALHSAMVKNGDYVQYHEKQYALRNALKEALPDKKIPDISTVVKVPDNPTLKDALNAVAESLPRNLSDMPARRPGSYVSFDKRYTDEVQAARKKYQDMVDQAAPIIGAEHPRVVELQKLIDENKAGLEKEKKVYEDAAAKKQEEERVRAESDARKDAEYFARFGGEPGTALKKYAELSKWKEAGDAIGDRALKEFDIKENRLTPTDISGLKLKKSDVDILREAKLNTDGTSLPRRLSIGQETEWKARGWLDENGIRLTEEGERAALGVRQSDAESQSGLPMSKYKPGSGKVPDPGESRFAINVPIPYKGEVYHTNGHYLVLGPPPKYWTAPAPLKEGESRSLPDIGRVIPEKMGTQTKPVGFYTDPKHRKPLIGFDNGSAMDSEYFDYINKTHAPDKWTSTGPKDAYQAWKAGKMVGLVMPMRVTEPPKNLAKLMGAEPETIAKPGHASERGSAPLGAPIEAAYQTIKRLGPVLHRAGANLKVAQDDILKIMAPAAREGAESAALSVRTRAAEMARSNAQAERALEGARKALNQLPPDIRWDFYDRAENGEPEPNVQLQAIASVFRKLLDNARKDVQDLGTGKLESFIENYLPHIYKDPKKAEQTFGAYYGKAPMEGKKAFLMRRKYETLKDAMEAGLEPITDNPVDQVILKVREMQKYVMAHRVVNERRPHWKYIKAGERKPPEYEWIDDKIATVSGPRQGAVTLPEGSDISPEDVTVHGRRIMGQYAALEPEARVINNYLSPGLREKSALFRAYLSAANSMNQFNLGFSAFHLGFTTVDAATSKLALGIYEAAHGHPIRGLKSAAQTAVAPFTGIIEGDKMLKEYFAPGTQGERIANLVNAMVMAGGRAQMDSFYQTKMIQKMMDNFRHVREASAEGNVGRAAGQATVGILRAPFALAEQAARPILEWIVPRQKMAVFADLAQFELDRLGAGELQPEQIQKTLAKAWDSVDNRMGQLVYDNLFWNKVFKDMLMASVRSVGWNVGTIREVGGGLADIPQALKGDMSTRLSYNLALPFVTGILGAIVMYLYTGHGPKELKDYFFPQTGRKDKNGQPERLAIPSYVKDIVHFEKEPVRTVQGKIHPLLNLIAETLENKDFFGHAIRNSNDPFIKQLIEEAQHIILAFEPMALKQAEQEKRRGHSLKEQIPPFFGLGPAPSVINRPPRKEPKYVTPFGRAATR